MCEHTQSHSDLLVVQVY